MSQVVSIIMFNILTDRTSGIVNSYILMGYKKEVFRDTLDCIPNGVLLIDAANKKVTFKNKAMKRLFSISDGKEHINLLNREIFRRDRRGFNCLPEKVLLGRLLI